eukprot:5064304-Lingulodinium_polyedra.AAC.1
MEVLVCIAPPLLACAGALRYALHFVSILSTLKLRVDARAAVPAFHLPPFGREHVPALRRPSGDPL